MGSVRIACAVLILLAGVMAPATAEDRYVVHEWGTFTVLQDEQGNCLPGVNVNEESLPEFVYRLWPGAAREGGSLAPLDTGRTKGIPARYVAATMRMETPIIYVYPPKQPANREPLHVNVHFNGGWISEWYPSARVHAPGLRDRDRFLGELAANATGSIFWHNLQIGVKGTPPKTDDHVWLAPRATAAPLLATESGEREYYLFYRGIAAFEAPVRVVRDSQRQVLNIEANEVKGADPRNMTCFWLVDVRSNGAVAYRQVKPTAEERKSGTFATLPATFEAGDYAVGNLIRLRTAMKQALTEGGLFDDEADAMLSTWKLSYFNSTGLRLFFMLPRHWTDAVLPLNISQPADVQRVMIGRVELITPEQRETLQKLSQAEVSSPSWLWSQLETMTEEQQRAFWQHHDQINFPFERFGLNVPRDYQLYADLGRFRDALLLDALQRDDAGNLRQFVQAYQLADEVYVSGTKTK